MSFGGGGFFGSGASQAETYGGAQQQANNQAIQAAGATAPVISIMDNRQASGKYASIGGAPNINLSTTDHGAIAAGQSIGMAALDFGADTAENALYLAGSIAADGAGLTRRAMDQLADTFRWSQQQTGQTIEQALAFAQLSDKSEQGKAVGEVVKYAAWVGIAMAIAWALKGIKL